MYTTIHIHIKTHNSESRGQEEAAVRDDRVSHLHVHSTTLKFANALVKKLSLSYQGPSTFLLYRINTPTTEEIGSTVPE